MSIKDRENTKLTKEDIDKVRHIEGFPIGKDEDIIALSNPPYYTACPNPFIEDFIKEYGKPYDEKTDDYNREPFAADVSEGKNDPIYNAHSYHTKVPHKAIMRYILHYTDPGDIVFDGFCGTGMTGVAAQMCENPDEKFRRIIDNEMENATWGERKTVLNDLSPAATFIAYNYNTNIDNDDFLEECYRILKETKKEYSWMYETYHIESGKSEISLFKDDHGKKGRINFTVWSDVFICPHCSNEIIFWEVSSVTNKNNKRGKFNCTTCNSELSKRECNRSEILIFDKKLNKELVMAKQVPVLINYSYGKKKFEKRPDAHDLSVIEKINRIENPYWYPTNELPRGYNTEQPKKSHGVSNVHLFYTKRNLLTIAKMRSAIGNLEEHAVKFWLNSIDHGVGKRVKHGNWSFPMSTLSGTLYIPSLSRENNPLYFYENKAKKMAKIFSARYKGDTIISTQSSTDLTRISNNSMDYIFTDPPFGDNLNYSELSFSWESWINVRTNNKQEAIMNSIQKKGLLDYQLLIESSFKEFFRILKPNRWMTVEFHNSKNNVWNSIQESMLKAGFVIADVRILDKQTGSHKQVTTTSSVKQDLVISAYKPKESFRREVFLNVGTEETTWYFIKQHLEKLPIVVECNKSIEIITERQAFLLFDRMVAYHIMQGIPIPIDAADFYKKMDEKFPKRDGMYFLQDQVSEYDQARLKMNVDRMQMEMFVSDEKSAIAWLYKELETPQTYSDIQPKLMKEARSIEKHELLPELSVLLEDNFLKDDEGKWYIPDTKKIGDVMKLREKRLLKEFDEYLNSKGKLKRFRTEAVRAGFAKLWKEKNFDLIVNTADRLPDKVIQEDDKLLMYYDISLSRVE